MIETIDIYFEFSKSIIESRLLIGQCMLRRRHSLLSAVALNSIVSIFCLIIFVSYSVSFKKNWQLVFGPSCPALHLGPVKTDYLAYDLASPFLRAEK